jgi:hypothetical protein
MRFRFICRLGAGVIFAALAYLAATAVGGAATYYQPGTTGYDISFPQCDTKLPRNGNFGIIGVNGGLPWSSNPCARTQYQWADGLRGLPSFYANTANPGPISSYWNRPGPQACVDPTSNSDTGCSYNYGWNAAAQSFSVAVAASSTSAAMSAFWWLDVETMNSWNGTAAANSATIQGYLDYFRSQGVTQLGVYSTPYQWSVITGGLQLPEVANWVAGATTESGARTNCRTGFSGGEVLLSQYRSRNLGADLVCDDSSSTPTTPAPTPKPGKKR